MRPVCCAFLFPVDQEPDRKHLAQKRQARPQLMPRPDKRISFGTSSFRPWRKRLGATCVPADDEISRIVGGHALLDRSGFAANANTPRITNATMNVATAVYVGIMIGGLLIMGAMYLGPQ